MNQDLNWGLFKVTPQEGKKPLKQPMDLHSGSIITKDEAFVHSLDDAKAKLNGGSTILGYLPREGSRFVGIDLDACVDGDSLEGWADDVLGDTAVPDAVTPSGRGLRILQPRKDGDEATGGAGECNDVGFFTTDTRGFTVPLDLADKLDQIKRDDKLVARVLHRRGPLGHVSPELAAKNKAEFYGKWGGHWLNKLSEDQQREAVVEMLAALPREFVNDRHEWTNISMGLSQLEGMVRWDVETAWDDWSRKSNVYDQQGNQQQWRSYHDSKGLTIFTVLHHARQHDFDIKPWKKLAKAADSARRWEVSKALIPTEAEVIEPFEEDTIDLTQAPGLLGAIIDHAEATSNRETRFFGLAGGLSALAAISDHRFVVKSPHFTTPLNLQILISAPTGAGKEEARRIASNAADVANVPFMREPASAPALHATLNHRPKALIAIDEFGQFLQSMVAAKGHDYAMMALIMQSFTSAMDKLPARHYSLAKDNKPEVKNPFVNGLYTTTATELTDGLDKNSTMSGFLGRMLILWLAETPVLREDVSHSDDTEIRNAMQRIASWTAPEGITVGDPRATFGKGAKMFWNIPLTPDAEVYYRQVRRIFDGWMQTDVPEVRPLWSRAFESALRVAGGVALGNAAWNDTMGDIRVDLETLQYAVRLVACSIQRFAPEAEEFSADGDADRIHKRILAAARKHADADGWARQTEVIKAAKGGKVNYRMVKEELEGILDPDGYAMLMPRVDEKGEPQFPAMVRAAVGGYVHVKCGGLTDFSTPKGL